MADNQLDILIRILTDKVGGAEAKKIIEEVKTETTKAGAESVKTSAAAAEATSKWTLRKKELKDAVRGLAVQFPILGHLAHLALNPITIAVAGIAAAFKIWTGRVEGLTRALGGIEMPDVSADRIARLESAAAALGRFGEKLIAIKSVFKEVNADLDAMAARIEAIDKLKKSMGLDTGTEAKTRLAGLKDVAAAALAASGAGKIALAGKLGSPENEADLARVTKAAAEKAAVEKREAEARRDWLLEMRDMGTMGRILRAPQFALRGYQVGMNADEDINRALALERGNISSQQGIIDHYGNFARSQAGRASQRALGAQGESELSEAARLREEVAALRAEIQAQKTSGALGSVSAGDASSIGGIVNMGLRLANASSELAAAYRAMAQAEAEMKAITAGQRSR